jgi:hypothetical protein
VLLTNKMLFAFDTMVPHSWPVGASAEGSSPHID